MGCVVTGRCVDCKYTDCVAVCPNESFREVDDPAMVVIDPDICIDCGVCIPECPVLAIYMLDDVPEPYKEWIDRNKELAAIGKPISAKKDALPTAVTLDVIHDREKAKGWEIADPAT